MSLQFKINTLALSCLIASCAIAQEATIHIQADKTLGQVSRLLTGACIEDVNHEIYGGLYSQMIFGEHFQEPAPAPEIKNFKAYRGRWVVRDNAVFIEGADGPKLVSQHAPFKDGSAGVEFFFPKREGQSAAFMARLSQPRNGIDEFIGYEIALDPARQVLNLARHRNNYEPITSVHCDIAISQWIPVEVRMSGSVIEILVDNKSILRHDDAQNALAQGQVALRPWHHEVGYRNLWIKTGKKPEPLPFEQADASNEVSGMWRPFTRKSAIGQFALDKTQPFIARQSQRITFTSGEGEIGIENQSLNRWGMNFVKGQPCEGYLYARAEKPTTLYAALESRDGSQTYAEQPLELRPGDWQRLDIALTPTANDPAGRFALKLKTPASITLGYAFLQPGERARFQNLPVRRDVVEGLINQGVTLLRYGGSMVNQPEYRWKKMIGPRDRRPPYFGNWYPHSSNGWGIPDFLALCQAAHFEAVPDFCIDETPQDLADFIDYATAPDDSEWGRKRVADGHPRPFDLKYIELGNEERVDETYAKKFEALAAAVWAKNPKIILVVGDFVYNHVIKDPFNFTGADSRITTLAAHQRILKFAKEHNAQVWFDLHVNTDHPENANATLNAMLSFTDALAKIADGANHKVVVFEFNSGNHSQKRALANAQALTVIERDARIPVVCVANGLQPDKQTDNGWDQGLLFLTPSKVWLQPPGSLTQMQSTHYQPNVVQCDVTAPNPLFDANAKKSQDAKTLILQVVNSSAQEVTTKISLAGFTPTQAQAQVTQLAAPLEAANPVEKIDNVVPQKLTWPHSLPASPATFKFPPYSITFLKFE